MKIALEEQADKLTAIAEEVQRKVSEVANNTILKLKDFDAELAATLMPKFKKEPMWEKAFSFSLTGENEIPLNKRGSGVRRLVLFSFFRATTESTLFDGKDIIYAVEEPETSQHPDAQKMIVNTFREMTEKNGCQIILTTHVPGLAGLLPIQSLRYISNGEGYPAVAMGTDDDGILKRIADTLGVLPDLTPPLAPQHYNVKLVICVEGPNDVAFLKAISQIAHRAYPDIIDLNMSSEPYHLIAHLAFKADNDAYGYNHHRQTDGNACFGNKHGRPRHLPLFLSALIKATCNEQRQTHKA